MRKVLVLVAAISAVAVVPAWAAKPAHPTHPSHGSKSHASCKTLNEGYRARGTLVSAALTPAAKKGHYDGTITVDVTRANHKAATGTQTFTLTDARVRFGKGVDSTAPAAGDPVTLHGKMTAERKKCSTSGFTSTITVRNVRISAPKK